jgi:hypothetical protein
VALWVQPKRSGMRFQEEEYYGIDHYVDSPHIQLSDHRDAPRLNAAILVDSPYRFDDGSEEMSTGCESFVFLIFVVGCSTDDATVSGSYGGDRWGGRPTGPYTRDGEP